MNEKYPAPVPYEPEEDLEYELTYNREDHELSDDREQGNLAEMQMSELIDELMPGTYGVLNKKTSYRLAKWAKENTDAIIETLIKIGYPPETLNDASLQRLLLYLQTPNFVYKQVEKDRGNNSKRIRRQLSEYGEAIRDAVEAYPDMSQAILIQQLDDIVVLTGFPRVYQKMSTKIFEGATNGASAELIMSQLIQSETAQEAGIAYEKTSVNEDLIGADMRVKVPVQNTEGRVIIVTVSLNVKTNKTLFPRDYRPEDRGNNYQIHADKVFICPEIDWRDLEGRIQLDEEGIRMREEAMTQQLQEMARKVLIDELTRRGVSEHIIETWKVPEE